MAESLIQTLEKWFEGLRVGVGPSQRDNERGSGSCGTRSSRRDNGGGSGSRGTRLSRRRTLTLSCWRTRGPLAPSNEDENNQLVQFLAKQRNLLFLVFFMFMFLFFCFLVSYVGVFKKLL